MTPAHELVQETEEERLRQVHKFATDSGPNWADGFRPGSFGCHELLDRTDLLASLVEQQLLNHPACVAEAKWYALAERAAAALRELYQRVGAEHLTAESPPLQPGEGDGSDQERNFPPAIAPKQKTAEQNRAEDLAVANHDVELVAIWLHEAARLMGHAELVRSIMKRAADNAAGMYATPSDHATMEENDDHLGVRDVLGRFSSRWDELERDAKEDGAQS